jgi:SpoVK/Ycf46/Vps4 family AAA+-type ATPase
LKAQTRKLNLATDVDLQDVAMKLSEKNVTGADIQAIVSKTYSTALEKKLKKLRCEAIQNSIEKYNCENIFFLYNKLLVEARKVNDSKYTFGIENKIFENVEKNDDIGCKNNHNDENKFDFNGKINFENNIENDIMNSDLFENTIFDAYLKKYVDKLKKKQLQIKVFKKDFDDAMLNFKPTFVDLKYFEDLEKIYNDDIS